ncbi:type II secretion system protein GspL [Vibrio sp. 10N.286.49.B3]|uniref:type II secretion system protein GspL n=1 Tax=Vibrio sp. 10N.286.49.B3 TaxID=1880855 RepID=UPI000C82A384|nr:type II secretion system protein GspL [Vibrio sp. 10N.286.49.B3]PMH46028.1 type II secretion system protein GspL [Vibrio sp. 10N.286.49.B3]
MSEFLTVRLSSEQQAKIQWLVWSTSQQEVIASGEIDRWQQLGELTSYAQQRTTIALVSASDVLLTSVDIPPGGARQFDNMLPYLIEDEVAQDVEELHFSVLRKAAGKADICAIDRQWLQHIISQFKQVNIDIKKVLPDVLALPLPQENQVSAVECDGQWLLRKGAHQGASVDAAWLDIFCQSDWLAPVKKVQKAEDEQADTASSSADTSSDDKETAHSLSSDKPALANHQQAWQVNCYSNYPQACELTSSQITWKKQPPEMAMILLSQQAHINPINLLTGEFKAKSSFLKHWKVWQKVAVAGVMLVAAIMVKQVMVVNQYETQASAYRDESERIFRQVFPNKKRIPTVSYLKRQMNDEANALSGGGDEQALLTWLTLLPPTLGEVKGMELLSFKYDGNRDEVRLQAKSPEFQHFEQARVKFSEHFIVEQGQLNRNDDAVLGSFTLKRK